MGALRAPVATHAHMHNRGAPPVRLVRQAPDHRVTSLALTSAASTPPVLTSDPARQHCMVWPNALARHFQAQVIQARERAQVRAIKDSIGHVEVFQMDGVAISIIGRPRPLPGHDTPNPAHNTYTLNYEEPVNVRIGGPRHPPAGPRPPPHGLTCASKGPACAGCVHRNKRGPEGLAGVPTLPMPPRRRRRRNPEGSRLSLRAVTAPSAPESRHRQAGTGKSAPNSRLWVARV